MGYCTKCGQETHDKYKMGYDPVTGKPNYIDMDFCRSCIEENRELWKQGSPSTPELLSDKPCPHGKIGTITTFYYRNRNEYNHTCSSTTCLKKDCQYNLYYDPNFREPEIRKLEGKKKDIKLKKSFEEPRTSIWELIFGKQKK